MSYPTVSFQPTVPIMGMQPISGAETTKYHELGTIVRATDVTFGEGEFIYLKGAASTAAGDIVAFNSKTGATVRAVHGGATSVGPVGIAMAATDASTKYGWYQISGAGPVNTGSNTVLANASVYMTSTASQGDDAVVSGDEIVGLTSLAANSGGFTSCQIDRPSIPVLGGASGTNTGDVTLATVGSTPAAAGASLSGQVLTLQPADGTNAGVVSTATQTIAGAKTFSSAVSSSVATGSNFLNALDGARLNLSTADVSCYLYRSAANTIRTPGSAVVDGTTTSTGALTASAGVSTTTVGASGLITSTVATGNNFITALDGARLNISTGDASAYLYRSAANIIRTPGSLTVDTNAVVTGTTTLGTNTSFDNTGKPTFESTDGSGTSGSQTINKISGKCKLAAAASTLTITNSRCASTSLVYVWAQQTAPDTTALSFSTVANTGNFVIKSNANATADTILGFLVIN